MSSRRPENGARDEFGRLRNDGGGNSRHYDDRRRDDDFHRRDDRHDDQPRKDNYRNEDHHRRERGDGGGRNDRPGGDQHYGPAQGSSHQQEEDLHPGLVVKGKVGRIEPFGAFIEFQVNGTSHRGLAHISQLANQRVEQVTDVLQLKDSVHAVVLDIEQGGRRISLSLKDVDQKTGEFRGKVDGSSRGRGRPASKRELDNRSKQRREEYLSYRIDWRDGTENGNAPEFLRTLWSASPEPPSQSAAAPSKKPPPKKEKAASSSGESSSSESSSDDSSSDDDRRRRDRKRSRSSRNDKSRRKRDDRSRRRRRRKYSSSSESSSDDSGSGSSSSSSASSNGSREAKKQKEEVPVDTPTEAIQLNEDELKQAKEMKRAIQGDASGDSEDGMEGPMPLPQSNAANAGGGNDSSAYGNALLPGEGQAIAQYVQQNLRIPRRGEIGYSGDDIEHYEHSGYVMSGSRHAKMNAVRIRKENQVYSAEEQRALALITMEENQQKEAQLMEDFRTMLKEKQKMRQEKG
jgi:predicted RNA-binding protein with RPS1 domain